MSYYFNTVIHIIFILCVKLLSEKDVLVEYIINTLCFVVQWLDVSFMVSLFLNNFISGQGLLWIVHVCCFRFFTLHAVSVFYCHQCRQGVMAFLKKQKQSASFLHIVSRLEPLHYSWLSRDFMQGNCLFQPLHCTVSVKWHREWWSARVCCKGTSISMSCSTVNAKPFHSSEFSPLTPTLGHRVRTDNKWECYQTYPGKGNIDVWSCSGGGITNSFRCECAAFCLCLSARCQLTFKGKFLKVEPEKKKKQSFASFILWLSLGICRRTQLWTLYFGVGVSQCEPVVTRQDSKYRFYSVEFEFFNNNVYLVRTWVLTYYFVIFLFLFYVKYLLTKSN